MRMSRTTLLLTAALILSLILLALTSLYTIRMTSGPVPVPDTKSTVSAETAPAARQGLAEENGYLYFYNQDGTRFTDGYKELDNGDIYFFLPSGQAFTSGYKVVELDGVPCYFYFLEDGKAFTGGFRDIPFGDQICTYYFQDNGRALTSGWETMGDTTYYFQDNGRAAKDAFLTLDGSLYYFDEHAALITGGWFCLGHQEGYYYAGPAGKLATDTVIEGYKLDATGKSSTKYRIIQYVNAHTDPSMSSQEKIQALYDWILHSDMAYLRSYEHVRAGWEWKDSWVDDMAADHMDRWGGNCFRYAAFLGMLLREATGLPVTVCRGQTLATFNGLTPHSWACVRQDGDWYIYDVELQKFNTCGRSDCYKIPASESYLHLQGVETDLYS